MSALSRFAGVAAAVGGAAWVVKGSLIIATGDQPPVAFELGPPLFLVGLIGLHARLEGRGGRVGRVGGLLAYAGAFLTVTTAVLFAVSAPEVSEESFGPVNALILGTGLAILASLLCLGLATRRAGTLGSGWSTLPLLVGVLAILSLFLGGAMEQISERLLEVPIVVIGLAWIVLGYALWSSAAGRPRVETTRSPGAPQRAKGEAE